MIPYIYRKIYTEEDKKASLEKAALHAIFSPEKLIFSFQTDQINFKIANLEVFSGQKAPFSGVFDVSFKDFDICAIALNDQVIGEIKFEVGGNFAIGFSGNGVDSVGVDFVVRK
ncbi:hypothetical protein SS50377_25061 [Spironucleus salmonicida]|uniref:Uncharacterized protein n=1 Tax=Spironucleus salmonicida TaxID=348837 RepID=V6LFQ6_9EUKA|nr:hypothetical protein SS50377_25061 [Spironucleus salmonicida]|eukprot:EST43123.1 Hypothetical protein SS50377_17282 [Spironucleus salmonicida]